MKKCLDNGIDEEVDKGFEGCGPEDYLENRDNLNYISCFNS